MQRQHLLALEIITRRPKKCGDCTSIVALSTVNEQHHVELIMSQEKEVPISKSRSTSQKSLQAPVCGMPLILTL